MGARLNLEITDGGQILASCCFYDAANTESALDICECFIKTICELFGGAKPTTYAAVKTLEAMGAGINGVERNRIKRNPIRFDNISFEPTRSAYNGWIFVTEEGIDENRRWESARVKIDLSDGHVDFHAHYYTYLEEYIEFTDRVPDAISWEELPRIDVGPDIFTGVPFQHLYVIRKIYKQYPDGFRISCGDVIEWM